ncbi:MAG: alpha/beta fold hydrolase [Gemmatimonadota bacterium]|jgi:dienelactone hydrolase
MRKRTRAGRVAGVALGVLLGVPGNLGAQGAPVVGVYRVDADRHVIVRGTAPDDLSILDGGTGQVRNLTPGAGGEYTHGPTRSLRTPATGRVVFEPGGRLTWTRDELGTLSGRRLESDRREIVVGARDGGRIQGELLLPAGSRPHPVVVVVPLGDRQSLWEPAMWLRAAGIGVLVYDQRGSGRSSGTLFGASGNSHTLETLQLADDAVAVVRHARRLPGVDPGRIGILGWSQGGWIAAMAASRLDGLAFCVNIAANANPWPEQAEHRFLARLQREGFEDDALAEAGAYFQALRAVSDFRIGWQAYTDVRERYEEEAWYRTLVSIFPFFVWEDYGDAVRGWSVETSPEVFFRRLSGVPTLGVYFEFDQSNPPDSPRRFRRAVEEAGNASVDVRTFPGTNHGAWVVDGYAFDPEGIERRDPAVFAFVASWVTRHVGSGARRDPL